MKLKKCYYLIDHVTSLQLQCCAPPRTQVTLIVHYRTLLQPFLRQAASLSAVDS